jgi:hypothetical protein
MRYQLNVGVVQITLIVLTINYFNPVNCFDNTQDELINPQDAGDSNIQTLRNNLENYSLNQDGLQSQIYEYNKQADSDNNVNGMMKADNPNENVLEMNQMETNDYGQMKSEINLKENDSKLDNYPNLAALEANYKQLATVTISNRLKEKVDSNEALSVKDLDELSEWVNQMQAYVNSFPKPDKSETLEAVKKYDREKEDEDFAIEPGLRGPVETEAGETIESPETVVEAEVITANVESGESTSEASEETTVETNTDTETEAAATEATEEQTEVTKREKKKVMTKTHDKGNKMFITYTNKLNNLIWAIGGLLVIVLIMVASIYSFVIKPSKKKVKHYEPVSTQFTF